MNNQDRSPRNHSGVLEETQLSSNRVPPRKAGKCMPADLLALAETVSELNDLNRLLWEGKVSRIAKYLDWFATLPRQDQLLHSLVLYEMTRHPKSFRWVDSMIGEDRRKQRKIAATYKERVALVKVLAGSNRRTCN